MKIDFSSQRREMHLFLHDHQHGRRDVTCKYKTTDFVLKRPVKGIARSHMSNHLHGLQGGVLGKL